MSDVCDNCDLDALIDNCARCGAPVCCSHCCQVDALTKRIAELEAKLAQEGGYKIVLEASKLVRELQEDRIAELADELKSWEEQYKEQYIFAEQMRERTVRDHDKIIELESELKHLRRFRDNIAKINEDNGDE